MRSLVVKYFYGNPRKIVRILSMFSSSLFLTFTASEQCCRGRWTGCLSGLDAWKPYRAQLVSRLPSLPLIPRTSLPVLTRALASLQSSQLILNNLQQFKSWWLRPPSSSVAGIWYGCPRSGPDVAPHLRFWSNKNAWPWTHFWQNTSPEMISIRWAATFSTWRMMKRNLPLLRRLTHAQLLPLWIEESALT